MRVSRYERLPDIRRALAQSGGVVSRLVPGFDAAGALAAISLCENYVVLDH
jgi:hypothetical protein